MCLGEEGRPCYAGIKTSELKVQRYKGPDGRALLPIITIEELHRLVLIFERLAAVIN
jgi:hypothetical protein